ncbi:MAG: uroporphyrinogen-III C-methyltransferase [Sedimentisphaerales bacterium]|nr:uroporphyrinogen-III C-methyltransferase [Sedimentisphaerales bacterium]
MSHDKNLILSENNHSQGIVYLVGAGPGDPGLITVRGQEVISQADVVIYDYLASPRLLAHAEDSAELIYVGKQAGCHSLPQPQINQLIIDKARAGKKVVRLKGGDPFVFGRGGEEAADLSEAGIEFEIIPGVTAGVAAPAYAGIPVTHRDYASDLALITGQEDADRTGPSQIDWSVLGRWKGTLVFYMGVKNLPDISAKLQEHGMDGDTPAGLIRWGTTPQQRTLIGTLATLPDLAVKHQFLPPAIILIGKVIQLREQLEWFEKRPLFGRRIVVTRSRAQASDLVSHLERVGAEVLEFPTIKIEPPEDDEPLRQAAEKLGKYDWVIFTSVNGVDSFFTCLHVKGYDARRFSQSRVCAIGPATALRLREFGIVADLIPQKYVAESILDEISQADSLNNKKILLPRADIARRDLPEGLKNRGAEVDEIQAYRTMMDESPRDDIVRILEEDTIDWITFTSSSTVRNLLQLIELKLLRERKLKIASIGPVTSATIKEAGLKVDVEAREYTITGLVKAICDFEQVKA